MMSYVEGGLTGASFRHGARKPRGRFARNWSVHEEEWIAHEEVSEELGHVRQDHGNWDIEWDDGGDLPLSYCWWLLIADRAGRNHFGRPSFHETRSNLRAEVAALAAPDQRERSACLDELLKHLDDTLITFPGQSQNSAVIALGRHPFFLAGPDIGFETPAAEILEAIVDHRSFWLRDPAEWKPPIGDAAACLADLFNHLLGRYELPDWLALRINPTQVGTWNREWLRLALWVGQGGSLYQGLHQFYSRRSSGPILTRHGVQLLGEAPSDLSVDEAIYYALVLQSGGDATAVWDFLNYSFRPRVECGAPVVRTVAPWLTKNRSNLAPTLGMLVAAWAFDEMARREQQAEQTGALPQPFSLKKRSVRSVMEQILGALSNPNHPLSNRLSYYLDWQSHGWDQSLCIDGVAWTFREICSLKELAQESHEMNHCVFQYWGQCLSGETMIFSLKSDHGDRVTVQICPLTHILLQIRGHSNRAPTLAEQEAAQQWLRGIYGTTR